MFFSCFPFFFFFAFSFFFFFSFRVPASARGTSLGNAETYNENLNCNVGGPPTLPPPRTLPGPGRPSHEPPFEPGPPPLLERGRGLVDKIENVSLGVSPFWLPKKSPGRPVFLPRVGPPPGFIARSPPVPGPNAPREPDGLPNQTRARRRPRKNTGKKPGRPPRPPVPGNPRVPFHEREKKKRPAPRVKK